MRSCAPVRRALNAGPFVAQEATALSLRPSIYAADIRHFRSAIAGERAPLVKSIEGWYRDRGIEESAVEINREIDSALGGGWAGRTESDRQVYLVAALACACDMESEAAMIHWGDWKIGAYDDYFDMLKPILPASIASLCEFIRSGRAMFGSRIETDWSYYSYLVAEEVRTLAAALDSAHVQSPDLDSPNCIHGFPTEFRGWIKQIEQRRADLWLFAE
jgi:hypothetical protein